jgi:hypothetical protein
MGLWLGIVVVVLVIGLNMLGLILRLAPEPGDGASLGDHSRTLAQASVTDLLAHQNARRVEREALPRVPKLCRQALHQKPPSA